MTIAKDKDLRERELGLSVSLQCAYLGIEIVADALFNKTAENVV